MDELTKNIFKGERVIWVIYGFLVCISLVEGFSSQSFFVRNASSTIGPLLQHAGHLFLGFLAIIGILHCNYKYIRMIGWAAWIFSIILLLFTFFAGASVNGSARWIFGLQPSEIAKFGLILSVADWIQRSKDPATPDYEQRNFKWLLLMIFVTCGLIFPGNLSTAALLFGVIFCMLFCGGIAFKRLAMLAVSVLIPVGLIIGLAFIIPQESFLDDENHVRKDLNVLQSGYYKVFGRAYTWKNRITRHGEEDNGVNDTNRQVIYSQVAIAQGGLMPHAPGSSQLRNNLPQAYSDFVFSIVVEEGGALLGGIFVILLYVILLWRAGHIATKSTKVFPAVLAIGVSLMIVLQALIHMLVCVALIPVTGQPLPLITRGGTSILVSSVYFGLLLNITNYAAQNQEATPDVVTTESLEENN